MRFGRGGVGYGWGGAGWGWGEVGMGWRGIGLDWIGVGGCWVEWAGWGWGGVGVGRVCWGEVGRISVDYVWRGVPRMGGLHWGLRPMVADSEPC